MKILHIKKYDNIQGFWIIENVQMNNVQSNHKTVMKLSHIKINSGIKNSMFTERMMKRGL